MPSPGMLRNPGIIGRRRKTRARRGAAQPAEKPTAVKVTAVAAATSVLTVTYDQPVILRGVPAYAVDPAGPTPISAARTAPDVVAITYSASVATITGVTIPANDPAVRNATGGYVQPYDGYPIA